jgi:methyltransferase family protein
MESNLKLNRRVEPELLDELPPDDSRARRSRQDLRRLNSLMGHAEIVARALARASGGTGIKRIVEIGAGDGRFSLSVARRLAPRFPGVNIMLVDRQHIVSEETQRRFREMGWSCEAAQADVFDWLSRSCPQAGDFIVANLFLHHFSEVRLRKLLSLVAERARCLAACEPRRSRPVLAASRSLGLIGCNAVTRHDAVISVRAGFRGKELSNLWTLDGGWLLEEREAGLFSHLFTARRVDPERPRS